VSCGSGNALSFRTLGTEETGRPHKTFAGVRPFLPGHVPHDKATKLQGPVAEAVLVHFHVLNLGNSESLGIEVFIDTTD
jgi:hypothetical protein